MQPYMILATYLELGTHHAEPGGKAKDETICLRQLVCSDDGNIGLVRCVHLGQHLFRKSLGNLHGMTVTSLAPVVAPREIYKCSI